MTPPVAIDADVAGASAAGAEIVFNISGGKDLTAGKAASPPPSVATQRSKPTG